MELRHLRYFLEVARTLHFGAAAELLNIATPTLSVQISQLERELGTPLFLRTQRSVQLTQAGEILREEAEATLRQADQARERVLSAARGERGYIRVGYVSSALMSGVLGSLFHRFRADCPDVTLEAREMAMDSMAAQILEGKIDVALVRAPVALPGGIGYIRIHQDCFCLALAARHPLAEIDTPIEPTQLKRETFILPEQVSGTREVAQRGEFILNNTLHAGSLTEVLANVALGNGIAVIPAILRQTILLRDVVYKEIASPAIYSSIWLLYRKRERTPSIKKLITVVKGESIPG